MIFSHVSEIYSFLSLTPSAFSHSIFLKRSGIIENGGGIHRKWWENVEKFTPPPPLL